jgi:transposase
LPVRALARRRNSSNRDKPSGPITTASPSMVKLVPWSLAAAAEIAGNRSVGIEACASSHYWPRELQALGHTVRLMPPAYVKPYVKRQKNDAADAEAICERSPDQTCGSFQPRRQSTIVFPSRHRARRRRHHRQHLLPALPDSAPDADDRACTDSAPAAAQCTQRIALMD